MGVFDGITNELENAAKQGSLPPGLHEHLTAMLNDPRTGGITGLVQKFKAGGLGGIIASWIGTGANQPVTPQQIQSVLGADHLQLVDRLTPNGQVPSAAAAKA